MTKEEMEQMTDELADRIGIVQLCDSLDCGETKIAIEYLKRLIAGRAK